MYADLRSVFWWPGMKKYIALYVAKCLTCSKVKARHHRPYGLLEQPPIPEWKWEDIAMDFITKLPSTRKKHDSIWVIIDRLTKSAHFIPIKKTYSVDRLAHIYVERIVCHHGTPLTIISDRDGRFTFRFWESLQSALGTRLDLSTAYHPQSDGQSEQLSNIHPVFHVSNFKKFLAEGNFQIPLDEVRIEETMHFVERPIEIMDHKDKVTKRSRIPLVKVRWESKQGAEFTWECEDQMKENVRHSKLGNNVVCNGHGNNVVCEGHGNNVVCEGHRNNVVRDDHGNNVVRDGNGNNVVRDGNGNNVGSGGHEIDVGSGGHVVLTNNWGFTMT
ncbi:uncharacterized protein LOC143620798 [Bidens hawaiensis]|uniref:uncharacterized protein LOC143620798 n=1 Tax=Bidens hawaiensis TaxID=980011 RepID=UPI00404A859C